MDDNTTIKISSTNLHGEHSAFEYSYDLFLTATELADLTLLITEILHYSPSEIREAIAFYESHKYDRFIFTNEQRTSGNQSTSESEYVRDGSTP